jgi:hypothetical protein
VRGGGHLLPMPAFSYGDVLSSWFGRVPIVAVSAMFMPHSHSEVVTSYRALASKVVCASEAHSLSAYR